MNICVLIVSEDLNPYISELKGGLSGHVDIKNSIHDFLYKQGDYSILHFHWPEEITSGKIPTSSQMEQIKEALDYWQKKAVLVITRHNILPNQPNPEQYLPLYDLIYSRVHAVVHLGRHGLSHFVESCPNKSLVHKIIPHHMYVSYVNNSNRATARKYLKIPESKDVILCFGNIRNDREALMILKAYKTLKIKDKFLLVPRFFRRPSLYRKPLKNLWICMNHWYYRRFFHALLGSESFVENDKVQYYFNAADVVFIPRSRQLNSGVVFLAMTFGKVMIGPQGRNIGEVLVSMNNPVFDPGDNQSVVKALECAIQMSHEDRGSVNLQYADKYHSLNQSIRAHLALYNELLSR